MKLSAANQEEKMPETSSAAQQHENPADDNVFPQIGSALPPRGNTVTKWFTRALLALVGWRLVGTIPNLPKMLLIGAPHTSNWDFILTIAAMFALGVKFSWMAKQSVFRWPIDGFMRWLGGFPVNRSSSQGYVDQVVAEFNRRKQFLLAITPEGTRQKVTQWKTGFYHMALGAGVPILLVAFDFGNKAIRLGPLIVPSGDYAADLELIQGYYAGIRGRYPRSFAA